MNGEGEFVELGPAIVVEGAPARLEESLPHEAKQTGIELEFRWELGHLLPEFADA